MIENSSDHAADLAEKLRKIASKVQIKNELLAEECFYASKELITENDVDWPRVSILVDSICAELLEMGLIFQSKDLRRVFAALRKEHGIFRIDELAQ